MAAGLPVVANPVGINRRLVVHGETGFLATGPAEWASAISQLARDPQLRRKMGDAGRRRVDRQFNAARWGPRFAAVVAEAARTDNNNKVTATKFGKDRGIRQFAGMGRPP